ncbi:putative nucleotidyltransferase substrate binding domain-containing protein [Sulfurimonas sp.]|uniref:putative nucleotidyltransferase substrate binding domain-containing protein n=1 Tax=Sulfurimonas sp. TaxID=2022749 RepID=UPI002B48E301|nr:putative nucleotidyltransferase substrate binding domain-containing protein [Sulfurimonas sp.]
MSILEQRKLVESIRPFDALSSKELDNLMTKIDIAYYPIGTLLISKSLPSIAFYIIIKGAVTEYIDDEVHNVYSEGDCFDADALIYSKCEGKFVVDNDLICYEIQKDDFLELMQCKKVQGYFLQDFVTRHQNLKNYYHQSELSPFLISKVSDMFLHKACIVEKNTTIYDALVEQKSLKANVIIVKDKTKYSIITDSDIRENVLLGSLDVNDAVIKIDAKKIISVDADDFLFNALLIMIDKVIKRVVVTKDGKIIGILEQLDLLSYFANHSHVVAVQIQKAQNINDLKALQVDLKNLIVTLKAKGVKVRYITKLVATLNIKVYKKLFEMCVNEELQKKCAFVIMGSEGRDEQTLKTDQDNALIIKDGVDAKIFEEPMMKLNASLLELGFPKCSDNIMISNEFWRRDVSSYKTYISAWIENMQEVDVMNLSIFADAKCVGGDESLVDELKKYLHESFHNRDDVLAHIAKSILNFQTPLSIFSGFVIEKEHENRLNLKEGGIFALVHGARTLCLKYEIKATNTIERIKELNNKGVIDKTFAVELIESFDTLSSFRLQTMLKATNSDEQNYINPQKLDKIQKDLLKDSFKIVNKFKKFITYHFHLSMVA